MIVHAERECRRVHHLETSLDRLEVCDLWQELRVRIDSMISPATESIRSPSSPYSFSPISDSPESFRRTRLKTARAGSETTSSELTSSELRGTIRAGDARTRAPLLPVRRARPRRISKPR